MATIARARQTHQHNFVFLATAAVVALAFSGCYVLPYRPAINPANAKHENQSPWHASDELDLKDMKAVVGVAISGGGSRAANFSAAVLHELDKRGLLQHASVI